MSSKLSPIVVPVVVDSSGVDKGMRTAKNKMRAGAISAGNAGVIGGGGGEGGGSGFASMAFAAAVGTRLGNTKTGTLKGFRGRAVAARQAMNQTLGSMDVLTPGLSGEEMASRFASMRAAQDALQADALNRASKLKAVRRGMTRRGLVTAAFGRAGTQPGRIVNSIAGSIGVKEAFRAVGPVGVGAGAAALATAALGNYNQNMLSGVGNLPMNYRMNSPQFQQALNLKQRYEATERPEAGFMPRLAIQNPGLNLGLDFASTMLGGIFSAETLGMMMPGGNAYGTGTARYGNYWSQRWDAFTTRNWGTPKELMDLRNEQRRQSRIMNRTAI